MVTPAWLDQAPQVDYSAEKELLQRIMQWGVEQGWEVSDGSKLPYGLRARTDVLLEKPEANQRVRLAVLRKSPKGTGEIRADSSDFVTLELMYDRRRKRWSVEAANAVLADDLKQQDLSWLFGKLFRG